MDLIKSFEVQQAEQLEELQKEAKKTEQGARFVEEALQPLRAEREKARMMVKTMAPERERELKM